MLTLGAWVHDIDPFAFRITEEFGIRWYGLAYVAGFLAAWWILHWFARRWQILVPADRVADLILVIVVGTLVGGRLGYVLIYQPDLLLDFSSAFPWWGLFALHKGGMASHGAMIGLILAAWLFARHLRVPALHVMDLITLAAPVGVFLGRIANFINGELLGKVVAAPGEPAPWWSVKFPQELVDRYAPVLAPAFDSADASAVGLTPGHVQALRDALRGFQQPDDVGLIDAAYRVIDRIQSGDSQVRSQFAQLLTARHPSQLYQALAEGLVVAVVLWLIWSRPRRPGVIGAWFLIIYGIGRILTEFVRLPDSHLTMQRIAGLSRGQWLSSVMVVAGFCLLLVLVRRGKQPPIGGWRRPEPGAAQRVTGAPAGEAQKPGADEPDESESS